MLAFALLLVYLLVDAFKVFLAQNESDETRDRLAVGLHCRTGASAQGAWKAETGGLASLCRQFRPSL